ncbi:protein teflon [Drosophila simulans]|uniref:C2H2-type domain-containing protein n=1 Tax=Drosophila simulans TaxID=7240 RepID=A0A0J9REY4_DROSI|nr:protein teflon [Drosophila simulans]KMY94456.1 uncharacterized protein Dsimw501_GD25499 [Drosophila simulans]
MSKFLDMLSGSQCVSLEKCGDVVVSTNDCMIALYCHFCRDLFTQLPEFLRHLQSNHSDVLHFTKEHNVYSVEELLSGEQDKAHEDAQSAGHNSSSGDSRSLMNSEDSRAIDGSEENSDNSPVKPEQIGKQNEINLLAEVTNILLQTNDKEERINDELKPESGEFKGARKKANNESSSLKICDLKSHTIARTSRKRMSLVKNHILRVLDRDLIAKLEMKPLEPDSKLPITEPIQEDNIPGTCFQTPPKPIPSLSQLSVRKSSLTEANHICTKYDTKKTAPTMPKLLNNVPKSILTSQQAQVNSDSSEINETYHISEAASQVTKTTKSFPVQINQIEILQPLKLPKTLITPINEEGVSDQMENSTKNINNAQSLLKENPKKFLKKPSELEIKTKGGPNKFLNVIKSKADPIIVKRVQTTSAKDSTNKIQIRSNDKTKGFASEFNSTKIRKLKMENCVDLKTEDPCDNTNMRLNKMATIGSCEILKAVGLPAITDNAIEAIMLLPDELETMRIRADQFTKIYKKYYSIWNYRKIFPPAKPDFISQKIFALTREVNKTMLCNLANSDIKGIINQISVWHYNIYTQYIELDNISEIARYTLKLFSFLPVSFAYFCKWCDDIFILKKEYLKHLISHQVRFQCTKCIKVFKYKGYYEKHLRNAHP